jgi:hypothetical protein
MDRALWLLLRLRFGGWLRRFGRALRTVKGALLVGFLALLMCCWSMSLVSSLFLVPHTARQLDLVSVRRYGSLGLLAYCVLMLLTTAGEKALSFNPAEVNFLFPGPFSRRQLLAYRVTSSLLLALPAALFLTLWSASYAPWPPAAFVGAVLAIAFLQFFAVVVALIVSTVDEQTRNRGRRFLLLALALVALGAAFWARRQVPDNDLVALAEQIEHAPLFQLLLVPFGWFAGTFTAADPVEAVQFGVRSLAVDAGLLVLLFVLDAHYLEAAAAASERHYALLQRLRGSGAGTMPLIGPRKAGFSLPDLPRLGGAGPIAWRQMVTALRSLRGLLVLIVILLVLLLQPILFADLHRVHDPMLSRMLAGMAFGGSIFLMQMLPFDFRGDVDRMEVLKSLPVTPLAIVAGQLVTPVLLSSAVQLLGLFAVEATLGGLGAALLVAAALFALPFNWVLFEVVNLLFLLFPARMTPTSAGDLQMMGRQTVLVFAIWLSLLVLLGIPAALAAIVYLITTSWPATLIFAWVLLVTEAGGLLPLLVMAFRRFDVARDTPP